MFDRSLVDVAWQLRERRRPRPRTIDGRAAYANPSGSPSRPPPAALEPGRRPRRPTPPAPTRNPAAPVQNGAVGPATADTAPPTSGPRIPAAYSGRETRLSVWGRRSAGTSVASRLKIIAPTSPFAAVNTRIASASGGIEPTSGTA